MENKSYKALVVEELNENEFFVEVKEKTVNDLPAGDVVVRVKYSSLNYKDALSAIGNKGVTRNYPH
ncbi:MAG: oxidoreductase, partial [Desulfobacteraceae bacterium]|nr:oxidoreductase [Desulfobacteraceae bacterium]